MRRVVCVETERTKSKSIASRHGYIVTADKAADEFQVVVYAFGEPCGPFALSRDDFRYLEAGESFDRDDFGPAETERMTGADTARSFTHKRSGPDTAPPSVRLKKEKP